MSLLFVPFSAARTDDLQGVYARRIPQLVALAIPVALEARYQDWFVPGTATLLLAEHPVPDALLRSQAGEGADWVVSGHLRALEAGGTWSVRAVPACSHPARETSGEVAGSWAQAVDQIAAWCSGLVAPAQDSASGPPWRERAGDGLALRELLLDLEACSVAHRGGSGALDQPSRLWRHLDQAVALAPEAPFLQERRLGRAAWLAELSPELAVAWRNQAPAPPATSNDLSSVLGRLGVSWPPGAP